jgi:lambda repressor-like predicted transcriptional regulator
MTFVEYYYSLGKKDKIVLRNKIVAKARISHTSIYNWLNKPVYPHPLVQEVISKIIGKSSNELWP